LTLIEVTIRGTISSWTEKMLLKRRSSLDPKLGASSCVHQLRSDPDLLTGLLDAAIKHIFHFEISPQALHLLPGFLYR
jgi:hypothetical protein